MYIMWLKNTRLKENVMSFMSGAEGLPSGGWRGENWYHCVVDDVASTGALCGG
jgi:hypothetical protein